jgi:hypothetical protein
LKLLTPSSFHHHCLNAILAKLSDDYFLGKESENRTVEAFKVNFYHDGRLQSSFVNFITLQKTNKEHLASFSRAHFHVGLT